MKRIFLSLVLVSLIACAKSVPPNLSPAGVAAYQGTKVILALDVVRDAAIALADASVITRPESVKVVQFHKAAITTIHSVPNGWKTTVMIALDSTRSSLSVTAQNQLGHYFDLAKSLINEVTN